MIAGIFLTAVWMAGSGWRLAIALVPLVLAACTSAGPPATTYVLGLPLAVEQTSESLLGRPVLEVKPVQLPDYVDVTDILVRRPGNVLEASRTGRWAERLSAGATRALADGVARRLPDIVVTTSSPAERPLCEITVDVETFERSVAGPIVLVAQWRVLDSTSRRMVAGERVTLTEPLDVESDMSIVAAMSRAIEALAERAAASIRRTAPVCSTVAS